MATKIRRIRRIGAIAIGTVKAIFRTGRVWGTTRTRVATARRPAPTVSSGAALAVGAAGGAAGAYFLDPKSGQRRRRELGKRVPAIKRAAALAGRGKSDDDEPTVDKTSVQMAAGNGAGAPVAEKETVAAGA